MKQDSSKKDSRTRAIESNPCGICRSLGLTGCLGHYKKGGSSDNAGSAESYQSESSLSASRPILTAGMNDAAIKKFLTHYDAWHLLPDTEMTFESSEEAAVFHITLDMDRGLLEVKPKKELSPEQAEAYEIFVNTLKNEALLFTQAFNLGPLIKMNQDKGTLIIKIEDPRYYDLFIQRLLDKNLLPTRSITPAQQRNNETEGLATSTVDNHASTAPNPFDISRGPRPDKTT